MSEANGEQKSRNDEERLRVNIGDRIKDNRKMIKLKKKSKTGKPENRKKYKIETGKIDKI